MITFEELCAKLSHMEETELMELLELHSDELVARCKDIIEDPAQPPPPACAASCGELRKKSDEGL